jgi:hypothetical protein
MTSPTKNVAAPTEQKRKKGHAELPVAVAMTTPPMATRTMTFPVSAVARIPMLV